MPPVSDGNSKWRNESTGGYSTHASLRFAILTDIGALPKRPGVASVGIVLVADDMDDLLQGFNFTEQGFSAGSI